MKKTLLIPALLLGFAFSGYSQKIDREELAYYQGRYESARSTKKVGNSLLIPGGVIFATGVIMIASAEYDTDPEGNLQINDPNFSLGAILTINGLPMTIVGGIISLAANSGMKRAQKQLDRISLTYYQKPTHQGVGLTFRF